MKNLNKARLIIYVMGLILAASVFSIALLPTHSHELLRTKTEITLPDGVHIPININTADNETLCLLDGIGKTRANSIIAYREEHGAFKTKEEIINVHGIGEKTFEKIKNYICV